MTTPVHCTQCPVPVPRLCPHRSAADLLAPLLDSTTTGERITATMEVMQYIIDLQKAVLEKPVGKTKGIGKKKVLEIVEKMAMEAFSEEDDPTPSQRNKMANILNEMLNG